MNRQFKFQLNLKSIPLNFTIFHSFIDFAHREGRWDPMAWHCGQPTGEAETPPVGTLEFRKRTRSNAADKDVDVILSPQRMSFGNGCAGSKIPPTSDNSNSNTKRLNGLLPKTKFDKNSERTRDPDREKHLQKMNGNSVNREQIRKAIRDLHENRDRNKDGSAPTKVCVFLLFCISNFSI